MRNTNEKSLVDQYTVLNRLTPEEIENISSDEAKFITKCMEQNLEHMRHVEGERLTFNSIYLVLAGSILTFASSFVREGMIHLVYLAIFLCGVIALLLTERWNTTFDRHLVYAQRCYTILHLHYFGKAPYKLDEEDRKNNEEFLDDLNESSLLALKIKHNGKIRLKTRRLYRLFYLIILSLLLLEFLLSLF